MTINKEKISEKWKILLIPGEPLKMVKSSGKDERACEIISSGLGVNIKIFAGGALRIGSS